MKITFFETTNFEETKFKENLQGHDLKFFDKPIQDIFLDEYYDSDVICTFIHSRITSDLIDKMNNLKLICTRSTGTDHIDISYCKSKNIEIKNVPFYGENTVAEHAFALMLSLSRKIHKSYLHTLQGDFSTDGLQGFDLKDKTIGIIGGGRIGLHVARIARGFGMHVRIYDIRQDIFMSELINFKYLDLDTLISTSDIISLHVPLNSHTEHLINNECIQKMKDGVLIINTARGGLIDTDALIEGLASKKIGGAGLDVLEGEELLIEENIFNLPFEKATKLIVSSKKLIDNENVVMTPHNAFNSVEAVNRIIGTTINNLKGD